MPKIENLYLLSKEKVARWSLFFGLLIAFYGSLNPWFMWALGNYYQILSFLFVIFSMVISRTMRQGIYNSSYFLPPILAFIVLYYYQVMVNGGNVNGYISGIFQITIFYSIFKIDHDYLPGLLKFLSKTMGVLLLLSIPAYLLFLLGFPLPSSNAIFSGTTYSFTNYYFFLLDDRALGLITLPRFNSVFLEPAHLGAACVLLLATQYGRWKRWYNVLLMVASLMTFSLTAYVMLIAVIFLNMWVRNKAVVRKLFISASVIAAIVVGAFFYNGGNNLLHDLILIRMEVEDGELAGDNRVTGNFKADYEQFLKSSDIYLGRGEYTDEDFGNSGFRVYIYQYGFVGLFLLAVFYVSAYIYYRNRRAMTESAILAFMFFIVQAFSLWYCVFIPLYAMTKMEIGENKENLEEGGLER